MDGCSMAEEESIIWGRNFAFCDQTIERVEGELLQLKSFKRSNWLDLTDTNQLK